MENKNKFILFAIIGSLLLNMIMFIRLGSIKQEVLNVNNNNSNNIYMLESRINHLSSAVSSLKEENNWLVSSVVNPNFDKSLPGEIYLDLDFTIREIEKDANVHVAYKTESENVWKEVLATNIGGNSYTASLMLDKKEGYNYQIISKGNISRSSEARTIPSHFNAPNPLEVMSKSNYHGSKGSEALEYHFVQYNPIFDFHKVKRAEAKVYIDNSLDRVIEIKPLDLSVEERYSNPHFLEIFDEVIGFKTDIVLNQTKIIISVEFGDGTVHEGEIYPDERFMIKTYY